MKYRALISFSGLVSMRKGEVGEISDPAISEDLLKAGYIEEVKSEKSEPKKAEPKKAEPKKKTAKAE